MFIVQLYVCSAWLEHLTPCLDKKRHLTYLLAKCFFNSWFKQNMRWNYLNFQIEKGDIKPDDYDYVVMSVDMLVESALIRRQLKDRFPVKKKGTDRILILC